MEGSQIMLEYGRFEFQRVQNILKITSTMMEHINSMRSDSREGEKR